MYNFFDGAVGVGNTSGRNKHGKKRENYLKFSRPTFYIMLVSDFVVLAQRHCRMHREIVTCLTCGLSRCMLRKAEKCLESTTNEQGKKHTPRIDFWLQYEDGQEHYIEVKNCHMVNISVEMNAMRLH